ncbi:MAG: transcription antitermination factor NusB [Syntrophobacterales bacterium]|nr:transcription antitermination factor NusB [Syntrophobacterales bacterium]
MGSVSRSRCRELALQLLYQADCVGHREGEAVRFWRHFQETGSPAPPYLEDLVGGVAAHQEELDALIRQVSQHWRLERMSLVDRNLLRLAIYEMKYHPEVPVKVVINEAVELAKRYGSEDSFAFINGILDRVRQELGREV